MRRKPGNHYTTLKEPEYAACWVLVKGFKLGILFTIDPHYGNLAPKPSKSLKNLNTKP